MSTTTSSSPSLAAGILDPVETDTNCPLVFESMDNVSDAPKSSDEELSEVPGAKAVFAFDSSTSIRVPLFDFSLEMKSESYEEIKIQLD